MTSEAFAQSHVDSLYSLIDYVIERCPHRLDDEMQRRFDSLLRSFESFASSRAEDPPTASERLEADHLGRNYLIAHTAILQSWINRLRVSTNQGREQDVSKLLAQLDEQVADNFRRFFGEAMTDDE
jgi:hypothetical protein